MKLKNACEYENAVVKSLKSGASADEVSAHLEGCADCRETVCIVSFFQSNLKTESAPKNLPLPGLVWWKSRLREKQRAAAQIGQPILIVQFAAAIIFGGLFVWLLDGGWLGFLALDRLFDSIDKIFVPLVATTAGFLFVCLILIFTLRRYLLEK